MGFFALVFSVVRIIYFSCIPGMLIRIVSLRQFLLASQVLLVVVFNCFHDNLHKTVGFLSFSFLGSDAYICQLHTRYADHNCLIETVLISITDITGCSL